MALVLGGPGGPFSADWRVVLGHLLGGATMLGAFFMVTDYGSSPSAPAAQLVFGALCGAVTMLFRLYSPWSEGFTFAVLIVNCSVPLLNRFVRPRVMGEKPRLRRRFHMRNLLGNYLIVRKSTVAILAVIGVVGFFAWKYYLKQKGVDPMDDAEHAVEKGARKAKDAVNDAAGK